MFPLWNICQQDESNEFLAPCLSLSFLHTLRSLVSLWTCICVYLRCPVLAKRTMLKSGWPQCPFEWFLLLLQFYSFIYICLKMPTETRREHRIDHLLWSSFKFSFFLYNPITFIISMFESVNECFLQFSLRYCMAFEMQVDRLWLWHETLDVKFLF